MSETMVVGCVGTFTMSGAGVLFSEEEEIGGEGETVVRVVEDFDGAKKR
jgi:hypothetical protein